MALTEPYFIVEVFSDATGEKIDEWHYSKDEYLLLKSLKKRLKIHRWQAFFTHLIRTASDAEDMRP